MLLFTFLNNGFSQNTSTKSNVGFVKTINYSKPFISEVHSTINKLELGNHKDYSAYNIDDDLTFFQRPMVDIHLGFDAPIYSAEFGKLLNDKPKWGVGISYPVSVHVLEDMWEPLTAAVIDVDYRFGSPKIVGIRNFDNGGFIKNISFSFLPIFHECTHLGDELVLALKDRGYPISRLNVSYEYTELMFTINDANGSLDNNHAFKFGVRYRISDRGYGWFSIENFAINDAEIEFEKSTHRSEFSFEYEMQRTEGFMASKSIMNIFSLDISSRVKFGIPVYSKEGEEWIEKDLKERNITTFNAYLGWRFLGDGDNTKPFGVYLHGYRGINYWGQLRNQANYGFFGIAFTYEP